MGSDEVDGVLGEESLGGGYVNLLGLENWALILCEGVQHVGGLVGDRPVGQDDASKLHAWVDLGPESFPSSVLDALGRFVLSGAVGFRDLFASFLQMGSHG